PKNLFALGSATLYVRRSDTGCQCLERSWEGNLTVSLCLCVSVFPTPWRGSNQTRICNKSAKRGLPMLFTTRQGSPLRCLPRSHPACAGDRLEGCSRQTPVLLHQVFPWP